MEEVCSMEVLRLLNMVYIAVLPFFSTNFNDKVLNFKLADQGNFLEQFTQGCLFLALVRQGKRDALMAGILCWKVIPKRSSSF